MKLLDRTREGPKLTDAGQVLVAHAEAAIARLEEAERELAAIAGLEGGELRMASFPSASATLLTEAVSPLSPPPPEGPAERRRRRARGVAAAAARRRARPRADASTTPRSRRRASATSTGRCCSPSRCTWRCPRTTRSPREATVPLAELADDELAVRLAAEHLRRGGASRPAATAGFEPEVGFESDDYNVHAGLHRRRARGDAAPRPRAADAALGPRRPPDRPAGARAARLGRDPRRGLALAGDRRDGRDPGRGRRARSPSATASACGLAA